MSPCPKAERASYAARGHWDLPEGAVLVKHASARLPALDRVAYIRATSQPMAVQAKVNDFVLAHRMKTTWPWLALAPLAALERGRSAPRNAGELRPR